MAAVKNKIAQMTKNSTIICLAFFFVKVHTDNNVIMHDPSVIA